MLFCQQAMAQDPLCYTQWEKELFEKINEYRKSKNLPPFMYSPMLTKAAQVNADGTNPNAYPRTSAGYNGIGSPLNYEFQFDYNTSQEAMDVYAKYFAHDMENVEYKGMGIARVNNKVITWLGAANETPANIPLCETPVNTKPYTWIIKPHSEFWEIAKNHVGKYIAVRNMTYWGIMDAKGEIVLPFQYWTMSPHYIEGQFIVTKSSDDPQQYIIDTTGKIIETFSHDGYIMLGENRIAYEGNYNYIIDPTGKKLTEKYQDIYVVGRNKLAFLSKNNLYGIMDFNGKIIIQPKYGEIMGFSEYLAAVKVGSKWGFVDTSFNLVIQPFVTQKEDFYFSNGLVKVKPNGKIGFMDRAGKMVLPAIYDHAYDFGDGGLAPVYLNEKFGLINKKGETVVPFEYAAALEFENGYCALGKKIGDDVLFAIVNDKGKILTDFEFGRMFFLEDHIKVTSDGRWGIIKMKN